MKKGKKLVHLIVPARTVRLAVLEKLLNTQRRKIKILVQQNC